MNIGTLAYFWLGRSVAVYALRVYNFYGENRREGTPIDSGEERPADD